MKLWLSRRWYLAATQPFHYCSQQYKKLFFVHRVNCAVFILIWSFKDLVDVSRCSKQIQIKQNYCAYAYRRARNLKCATSKNGWNFMVQQSFPVHSLPLIVFRRWWFPNIWSMLYTARGFDRGLWEVRRPRSAFMALIIIIEMELILLSIITKKFFFSTR